MSQLWWQLKNCTDSIFWEDKDVQLQFITSAMRLFNRIHWMDNLEPPRQLSSFTFCIWLCQNCKLPKKNLHCQKSPILQLCKHLSGSATTTLATFEIQIQHFVFFRIALKFEKQYGNYDIKKSILKLKVFYCDFFKRLLLTEMGVLAQRATASRGCLIVKLCPFLS